MIKYWEIHFYKNGNARSVSSSHALKRAFVSFPPFFSCSRYRVDIQARGRQEWLNLFLHEEEKATEGHREMLARNLGRERQIREIG